MAPGINYPTSNGASTNGVATTNGVHKSHAEPTFGFGTRAIHVGSEPDPQTGAVIPSISLSTTYKQEAIGVHKGYEYSRSSNPNRAALESTLASLEAGGAQALTFASGSATTATVLSSLGPGAHVVSVNDVYGGTFRYMTKVAAVNQGVDVEFVDLEDLALDGGEERLRGAIKANTKLIWIESPTNPTLRLIDIPLISRIVASHPLSKPLILVDNTFLSPFYSSPLLLGADIVMHSLTKYVNGHSDVVMGALIFPERKHDERHDGLVDRLRFLQNAIGAVPSAFDCWLAQRGAKTLHLRMKAHGENALRVAKYLAEVREHGVKGKALVEDVVYPGLPGKAGSYEQRKYELAWRMLSPHARKWVLDRFEGVQWKEGDAIPPAPKDGFPFSGMISVRLAPSSSSNETPSALTSASTLLTSLQLFSLAESLGGVESLAEHPAQMTHGSIPPAERELLGIGEGLVRLSVGVEDIDDLLRDLKNGLEIVASGVRD